jgi:hypothetical protein
METSRYDLNTNLLVSPSPCLLVFLRDLREAN